VFTKQGFRVTPAPCDYVAQNLPRESWDNVDPRDFLPSDTALQYTSEAVTEVAGIIVYWLAGKL
jgi:uncharacterized SAM-binding protein YcdF (DUF218 family)